MDAEKLKQKFNGAILKGRKIQIEVARPPKRPRLETNNDAELAIPATVLSSDRSKRKRAKKDVHVLTAKFHQVEK